MRAPIVTTSWDDGHPLDLRLAEMLVRYRVPSTFYVPVRNSEFPVIGAREIRELAGMGMEIGSHTLNHTSLPGLPLARVQAELRDSKRILEDILGRPVSTFCYPRGHFDSRVARAVTESGYGLGRTTVAFRTDARFMPAQMPVTLQLYRHRAQIHFKHAIKDRNFHGLLAWRRACGFQCNLVALAEGLFEQALASGGVFHLWGHSWEIEEAGLWGTLEEILKRIAMRPEVVYAANSGVLQGMKQ